jgi:hypothetical protein
MLQNSNARNGSTSNTSEHKHDSICNINQDDLSDDEADAIDEKLANARTALELQCDELLKILVSANLVLPRRDIKVMHYGMFINYHSVYTVSMQYNLTHHAVSTADNFDMQSVKMRYLNCDIVY